LAEFDNPDWNALFAALGRHSHDKKTWEILYSALWPRLNAKILERYPLSPDDAADIVQEAILEYQQTVINKKPDPGFTPSLAHMYGLVRFRALDKLREARRLTRLDELMLSPQKDSAREVETMLLIDEALDRLDPRCQYVLREFYFQGKTGEEIATRLKVKPEHIFVLLSRCRNRCREVLVSLHSAIKTTKHD